MAANGAYGQLPTGHTEKPFYVAAFVQEITLLPALRPFRFLQIARYVDPDPCIPSVLYHSGM